jgi:Acyl-CoA carboxylase epsilon subunit
MNERTPVADITSGAPKGNHLRRDQTDQRADIPIRLIRGKATPEELSALIAVVAVLTSAGSDAGAGGPGQSDRPSSGSGKYPRSRWSSPARLVRTTHPHGPGGWRASAFPRYRSNRPSGPLHTAG